MTFGEIQELAKRHKYVLLRDYNNCLIGINLGSVRLLMKKGYNPEQKLSFCGYIPCDLNTYITYKIPFL